MNKPSVSEKLFETWIQNHRDILAKGSQQVDDMVVLYGTAFHDGWFQALSYAQSIRKSVADRAQSPAPKVVSPRSETRPAANQLTRRNHFMF
jgi:hypothetical protein